MASYTSFVDPAASSSASQRADESDLDPAAFLKTVRELSEKREREDAERYRKLEEEIEKGRQERAARRAERARSISPEKPNTQESNTLLSSTNANSVRSPPPMTPPASSSSTMDPPTSKPSADSIPEFRGFGSGRRSKIDTPSTQSPAQASDPFDSASKPSPSATSLARSGTLSWQQRRPTSRGGSRPMSMVDPPSSASSRPGSTGESEPSRDQIAASLAARDPSWFKQTADRGLGNAAYRRDKDEGTSGNNIFSGRRGLPGMSRELPPEPSRTYTPAPSESVRSETASRTSSIRDSAYSTSKFSADRTSTSSKPDLKSLIAEDEVQQKASPMSEKTSSTTDGEASGLSRTLSMSSSQARLANATERPSSPTKGMGGFVQSAMMKRSDSVNKRWSAQPGPGPNRQNSTTSSRSGYGGLTGSHSMPRLEPTSSSREGSNEPSSRPSSSSSNLTNLTVTQGRDDKDVFVKPTLPHSRSKSSISIAPAGDSHNSPPSSPSKRWSPTKSSWLESAITKPESPKPSSARNSQPSWMADIAKAKAERASGSNTPKPPEDVGSRSASPTKELFGQGILKRSEAKDPVIPRTQTPKPTEDATPQSASPVKTSSGQVQLGRTDSSKDLESIPTSLVPGPKPKRSDLVETEPPAKHPPALTPGPKVETAKEIPPTTSKPDTIKTPALAVEPEVSIAPKPAASLKSPPPSSISRAKPETPPKPQTDFRSTLRSRPASDAKQQDAPEFLSKFGQLKKATTQNYVAPDVLKSNILRGKGELAKTDGPVKTARKDELKESLLAKKDQWKKEKDEGIVHERKISNPPRTPQKPEALAKRELLGRTESTKAQANPEKPKTATPEALARHRSLKEKPDDSAPMPVLEKQTSLPASTPVKPAPLQPKKQTSTPVSSAFDGTATQPTDSSRLAARFNPGLAGILARGPPTTNGSSAPSRTESPAPMGRSVTPATSTQTEQLTEGGQLQDMRKGRAKGPKRRKGGTKDAEAEMDTSAATESNKQAETLEVSTLGETSTPKSEQPVEKSAPIQQPKLRALPGSASSVMMAALQKSPPPMQKQTEVVKPTKEFKEFKSPAVSSPKPSIDKPSMSANSLTVVASKPIPEKPTAPAKSPVVSARAIPSSDKPTAPPRTDVPDFRGFATGQNSTPAIRLEDNKENTGESSPSVKSTASRWGRQAALKQAEPPTQIQLPSKKDEEAAMRSAGLLASSPSRPASRNGLGISVEKSNGSVETPPTSAKMPPKPLKSSRSVSGQLREASPNKDLSGQPTAETERLLTHVFGSVPRSNAPLSIDTASAIANTPHQDRVFRTVRRTTYLASLDGSLKQLAQAEEYTFFDESVYICTHAYAIANGPKKTEVFVWAGESSSEAAIAQAESTSRKRAKEAGSAFVHSLRQGVEPPGFLQALGGILVTRRGSREAAPKQYMLCGRKHLGQIVFDEVDFGLGSLCAGYAYLISYPATLQEARLYLWKGSACSTEEVSAARLAAIDLSETGEIIEVDQGAEFASFLKVFGPETTKASITKTTTFWQQKASAPDAFVTRLYRIQQTESKAGFLGGFFTRRPSWNNISPARSKEEEIKVEAKEISPFSHGDVDADGIYLLDAYSEIYLLLGPVFPSQPTNLRNTLFTQAILFAAEYAELSASTEARPTVPKALVLISGLPQHLRMLFRHWDDGQGLWGTAGLMAGSQADPRTEENVIGLDEVLAFLRAG